MYDPNAFLGVTLSGQLMLLDLVERLTAAGVRVLMVNTDGLMVKVRRSRDAGKRLARILREWQRDTAMELEVEPLKRFVLLAANNYATLNAKGKIKRGGPCSRATSRRSWCPTPWSSPTPSPRPCSWTCPPRPPSPRVPTSPGSAASRHRGARRSWSRWWTTRGTSPTVPKVARWYKSRSSTKRIVHHQASGNDTTPAHATEISLALDLAEGKLPEDLDLGWYIREARATIQATPGYRHFDPRLLGPGDTLAHRVLEAGLFPIPKRGKSLPVGASPALPTFLWDWPQYPTVGTCTGPLVSILVIDIDDAVKFRMWVDRGNSPLLASRWRRPGRHPGRRPRCRDRGRRAGRPAPGKLIFRFEADAEHFLAKIKIDRWKEKLGLEIFFGKGMPSVNGQHPDGSEYRLEGMLGEPPDWLIDGLRTPTRATRKAPAKPSNNGHMPGVLRGDETAKSGDETVVPGDEGTPPDIETAPFDVGGDAKLAALRADLAEADPELGKPSVGWWTKDQGDDRPILVGTCPYHDDGRDDIHAGYGDDGDPYIVCKHANCDATSTTHATLLEIHRRRLGATLEPTPLELTPLAESMVGDVVARAISLHLRPDRIGQEPRPRPGRRGPGPDGRARHARLPDRPHVWRAHGPAEDDGPRPGRLRRRGRGLRPATGLAPGRRRRGRRGRGRRRDEPRGPLPDQHTHPDRGRDPCPARPPRILTLLAGDLGEARSGPGHEDGRGPQARIPPARRRRIRIDPGQPDQCSARRSGVPAHARGPHRRQDPPENGMPEVQRVRRCDQCHQHEVAGEVVLNEPYQIRELKPLRIAIEDSKDGRPCSRPHRPLVIPEGTVIYEELVRVGDTTHAGRVTHWRGSPTDATTRRTAAITIYRSSQVDRGIPDEPPLEVLDDWLRFAHRPVIVQDWPISAGGLAIAPEELCGRIARDKKAWADGIVFPYETCAVRRLLFTDLAPLEQVRRFAEEHARGVVFAGATLGEDDRAILQEVWPDLAVREHQ